MIMPLLCTETPQEVAWTGLCEAAKGNEMIVRTSDGKNVSGYCYSTSADELTLSHPNRRTTTLHRSAIASVRIRRSKADRLSSFRADRRESLEFEVGILATPFAPFDLVLMPTTAVLEVVGVPVCAIWDLFRRLDGTRAIKIT